MFQVGGAIAAFTVLGGEAIILHAATHGPTLLTLCTLVLIATASLLLSSYFVGTGHVLLSRDSIRVRFFFGWRHWRWQEVERAELHDIYRGFATLSSFSKTLKKELAVPRLLLVRGRAVRLFAFAEYNPLGLKPGGQIEQLVCEINQRIAEIND